MELDQLKSAWNKMSEHSEKHRAFAESDIQLMLSKRTKDIYQKIGRNIRVGMIIVLAWIGFEIFTDFFFSNLFEELLDKPYMTEKLITLTYVLNIFIYATILLTISIFWLQYARLEKKHDTYTDLASSIQLLIKIIKSYKRMFYMILWIVILLVTFSFTTGFLMEFRYQAKAGDFTMGDFPLLYQIAIILSFILVLGVFIAAYLVLFKLFFRRLYGRYLTKLEQIILELQEESE